MANRGLPWVGAETRLLSEYLMTRWPSAEVHTRVRLGTIRYTLDREDLSEAEARMLMSWNRWADAVVVGAGEIIIVEACIVPDPGYASKLEYYCTLWRQMLAALGDPAAQDTPAVAALTAQIPQLRTFVNWPYRGHLLTAMVDEVITGMCLARGLTTEAFCPAWVETYLKERRPNRRA